MASVPIAPITALVDAAGNLVAAEGPMLQLQEEAGSGLGRPLAVPQLAALARLATKLGVPIERPVRAASATHDLDLRVRAEPTASGVLLSVQHWTARPPQPRRWSDPTEQAPAKPAAIETFETDAQLRVTSVSLPLARRLGIDQQELQPTPITRLFRLEAGEDEEIPLLDAFAVGGPFKEQRARARASDGSLLRLSGEPLASADDRFAGYRVEVEVEDGHAAAEPPRFDELLREPISSIISEAQRIASRSEGPLRGDYAAYAGDIAGAARHLLGVLQGMSAEAAEPSDAEGVDLAALAAEAASLVQPQASPRGIRLDVRGERQLLARGDARSVTQILVNLMTNAVRHSPEGGSVEVVVSGGDQASVLVADEGPGVAPWDRDRIFEAFEQAETGGGEAGLGLAISRRLAQSMRGDIALEDTVPGDGARFTLTLPLA
jgi:signal transduction histidine kinase